MIKCSNWIWRETQRYQESNTGCGLVGRWCYQGVEKTRGAGRTTTEKGLSVAFLTLRDLWDPRGCITHLPCSRQIWGSYAWVGAAPRQATRSPKETCLVISSQGMEFGDTMTCNKWSLGGRAMLGEDTEQVTREAVEHGVTEDRKGCQASEGGAL